MGYAHIENLYKNQTILLFRECFALEKIHGTSAHVAWRDGKVHYSPGGESIHKFQPLFNDAALVTLFTEMGHPVVTVFGEAYGGSQQGQSHRYGKSLKFAAFEVQIGDAWLAVPQADDVVKKLGMEFVHYERVSTDLAALDAQRDAPSTQAQRNGVEGVHNREGVVLRPIIEMTDNRGSRVVAKHKRDDERETAKPRPVVDPAKLEVLTAATAIAYEWVTPTRLQHVLDKLPQGIGMDKTPIVIKAMVEDVLREAFGEIVDSKEARQAIGKRAAELFKTHVITAFRKPEAES